MTPQEIFDKAYICVVRQGGPSRKNATGGCAYRGANGTACGVGHLIDDATAYYWDNQVEPDIESIMSDEFIEKPEWMLANKNLLVSIQAAHDVGAEFGKEVDPIEFIKTFKAEMKAVSKKYNLSIPLMEAVQ